MMGDPLDDYFEHDAEMYRKLQKLPVCDWCGERIYDDHLYEIGREVVCPDCIMDCRRSNEIEE